MRTESGDSAVVSVRDSVEKTLDRAGGVGRVQVGKEMAARHRNAAHVRQTVRPGARHVIVARHCAIAAEQNQRRPIDFAPQINAIVDDVDFK